MTNTRAGHALWQQQQGRAASGSETDGGDDAAQIAQVSVVIPMSEEQQARLTAHLENVVGRPVELNIRLDPTILGGVWVRMDDIVIDGTVRARLNALHEYLCSYCLLPAGAGPVQDMDAR